MNPLLFELCAESLPALRAAQAGGADQVELCAGLSCGGITPPVDQFAAAVRTVSIPVTILIRPRYGNFTFSSEEFRLMRSQVTAAREVGAAAVALGVLLPTRRVDVARTRELIELGRPMKVTFHLVSST
jgi:copper homeostasis protein